MSSRSKAQQLDTLTGKAIDYINSILTDTYFKLVYLEFDEYAVLSYEFVRKEKPKHPVRVYQQRCDYSKQTSKKKAREILYTNFFNEVMSTFSAVVFTHKMNQAKQLVDEGQADKV